MSSPRTPQPPAYNRAALAPGLLGAIVLLAGIALLGGDWYLYVEYAVSILALILCVLCLALTGWLYTTDRFWGEEWLEELHGFFGELFVPLVALHLAGVAYASWRHRESLVGAMITGDKPLHGDEPSPSSGDRTAS